jgi:ABC-type glycerol-3-phosphate transport system substrate-binding protein
MQSKIRNPRITRMNDLSSLLFRWLSGLAFVAIAALVSTVVGCSGPDAITTSPVKSELGSVSVWCPEIRDREELQLRWTAWANRTGAKVTLADKEATADLLCVSVTELGRLVMANELLTVPESVTKMSGEFQWNGLLRVYQSTLAKWGAKDYVVPLIGEGYAIVYRNDQLRDPAFVKAFTAKYTREPLPIQTWEDLADIAELITAQTGKPSLPPLPSTPADAITNFCQLAACYDRSPIAKTAGAEEFRRGLSFLTDGVTGEPRINTPGFVEAFTWFHATSRFRPQVSGDPMDAVLSGSAVAAVVPLAQLNRLPRTEQTGAIDAKFGVGSVPGTRSFFDAKGVRQKEPSGNFIPYYRGRLVGMVRKSAGSPETAWSLLAELGSPNGNLKSIGSTVLGCGPLRVAHVTDTVPLWGQYRFDKAGTASLTSAMKQYAALGSANAAVGLRTPDYEAIDQLILKQLKNAASGQANGADAARAALQDWNALDSKTPDAVRKQWRKQTAGME